MPHPASDHFQGKTIPEHLKDARMKGAQATSELHGLEISGSQSAFADTVRDTSLTFAMLWLLLHTYLPQLTTLLAIIALGWLIWKTARSASLGWARLSRLHRVIEEERWEIEHHREQEREELVELYRAKGFRDPLLTQVVDVLMADDNRLLEIMLDEELGLPMESYEHPLQQASFACIGGIACLALGALGFILWGTLGLLSAFFLSFVLSGAYTAKIQRIALLPACIWNVSIFTLSIGIVYLIEKSVLI